MTPDIEKNVELVKAWFDDMMTMDIMKTEKHYTEDASFWSADYTIEGREQILNAFVPMFKAFEIKSSEIHSTLTQDNKVALEFTVVATHVGEFQGIQATGKDLTWYMVYIFTIEGGKIAAVRDYFNVKGYAHIQQTEFLKA